MRVLGYYPQLILQRIGLFLLSYKYGLIPNSLGCLQWIDTDYLIPIKELISFLLNNFWKSTFQNSLVLEDQKKRNYGLYLFLASVVVAAFSVQIFAGFVIVFLAWYAWLADNYLVALAFC